MPAKSERETILPDWSGAENAGALAPTVTGFIVQATGSFVPALLVSAMIGLVSVLAYLLVVRAEPITAGELRLAG